MSFQIWQFIRFAKVGKFFPPKVAEIGNFVQYEIARPLVVNATLHIHDGGNHTIIMHA